MIDLLFGWFLHPNTLNDVNLIGLYIWVVIISVLGCYIFGRLTDD